MYNILNNTNILTSAPGFGISLCFLSCKEISFDHSLKNALSSRFFIRWRGDRTELFRAKGREIKKGKRQLWTSNNILVVNEKPTILKTF